MIYGELSREKHARDDGWLSELISMNYDDHPFGCVHSYVVSLRPGMTRARHYHRKKEEWLALAAGKVRLRLKDVNTSIKDEVSLDSDACEYKLIYLPPYVAHAIKNVGDIDASVVVFSRTPEDKGDTIPYEV